MPEPDDLPEELQALCRRNAIELPNKRWGVDGIVNNILTITYALNGVQYAAQLELSPDGNWLRGGYASAATGERGMVLMQRTQ